MVKRYVVILIIVILLSLIVALLIGFSIKKDKLKSLNSLKKELNEVVINYNNKVKELQNLDSEIKTLTIQLEEKEKFNSTLYKVKEEEIERLINKEKEGRLKELERDLEEWTISAQESATETSNYLQEEVSQLQKEISEYKNKQQAINNDILRQKELEEQTDFYRIQLSDKDKNDIKYLFSIEDNINNKQLLYKLIWSEFLLKPFNAMVNRVTEGKERKNCIYKITNLATQEIYIGKTRGVISKRWTEHVKTSLGIGSVSRTLLHTALKKYLWDSFSFEILEYDVKDLNSREKFWIDFYQSNTCGMNIRAGG